MVSKKQYLPAVENPGWPAIPLWDKNTVARASPRSDRQGMNDQAVAIAERLEYLKEGAASVDMAKVSSTSDLESMRKLIPEVSGGQVMLQSISGTKLAGGGSFLWIPDSEAPDDGGMVIASEEERIGRWFRQVPDKKVRVSFWGAKSGDDITAALTSAINWSKANGYPEVVIDLEQSKITGKLPRLNNSFDCVALSGICGDSRRTVVDMTGAPDASLYTEGGSGNIGGIYLRDMTIRAEGKSPISCKGFCGYTVFNVRLYCHTAAVLSTDIAAGTFTEFFTFNSCQIYCNRLFKATRGAGDGSFHGCGFTNDTIINKRTGSTEALIELNEGDTGRAIWYNAQMNGVVFWRGSNNYLISLKNPAVAGSIVNVSGNLRIEKFSEGARPMIGDSDRIFFSGTLQSLGGDSSLGLARRVDTVDYGSSAAPMGLLSPVLRRAVKAAGEANITLDSVRDDYFGTLVSVTLTASGYHYVCLLHILGAFGSLGGVVTTIATPRAFNQGAIGAPVFSMNGTRLVISGTPQFTAASVNVAAHIQSSVMNYQAPA